MLLNFKKIEKKHIIFFSNLLIALFFVNVLTFKKGYSYVPITLGTIATLTFLYYRLKLKVKWQWDQEDKYLILALIAYFFTFVLSIIFNGDGIRIIDNPSRILLFIPLIFFFALYPIKKNVLFHLIPIGSFITGILAIYQKFFLELPRPFPGMMSIQAGDIAISLAMFSIVISLYWFSINKNGLGILYIIFSVFGLVASILSGARGGWVSFPFCILFILACYYKNLNKQALLLIISIFTISILIFITRAEFEFAERYSSAKTDVKNYFEKGIKNSSQGARLDMWENGIIAINEKPLLGHGDLGYDQFRDRQIRAQKMAETSSFSSLHNQYLEAFVKRGIIGFTALMVILIVPLAIFIQRLKSNNNYTKSIAVLGIVHIISHMFFFLTQSFFTHTSGTIFYFFMLILLYHAIKQKENIN
ncbi:MULTISPECIES: O-antigen ligase family protein [unclassified Mannheimia]|uniref:O-antigen ligase family protein n=1 Tax=unclassified Mannheimia TaxID=2645054 RepID=UPI00359EDBE5